MKGDIISRTSRLTYDVVSYSNVGVERRFGVVGEADLLVGLGHSVYLFTEGFKTEKIKRVCTDTKANFAANKNSLAE